jgi:hypothetical protein
MRTVAGLLRGASSTRSGEQRGIGRLGLRCAGEPNRESEQEGAPVPGLAAHLDGSSQLAHDVPDQTESQSHSRVAQASGRVHLVEAIEDAVDLLGVDPDPPVLDPQLDLVVRAPGTELAGRARG